ncbi:MAG: helix-turn-helix domain-containing protein [Syntrophorhabdales bacterium]|jgi:excisionase family DNA binding protein
MSRAEKLEQYRQERKHPKGPAKRLYDIKEAAFYLGRSVDSLRELLWAGKIKFIKDGKRIYLDVRDMDAYIDRIKQQFTY